MPARFDDPSYHGLVTAGVQSQGYVSRWAQKISREIAAWGAMLSVTRGLSCEPNESIKAINDDSNVNFASQYAKM